MKQFTREQAIAIAESGEWKDWTDEEIVRLQLFQDRLCVPFQIYHAALGKVFDRPVYTHELTSSNHQNLVDEYLGKRPDPTLEEIIAMLGNKAIVLDTGA